MKSALGWKGRTVCKMLPFSWSARLPIMNTSGCGHDTAPLNILVRRSAPKVLHMPRTGSSCRILPRPEGYLHSVLRAASDLYPTGPPFHGLIALIMPKRDLQVPSMRSLQRVLGSKRSPMIGLSSESRVRATTSGADLRTMLKAGLLGTQLNPLATYRLT